MTARRRGSLGWMPPTPEETLAEWNNIAEGRTSQRAYLIADPDRTGRGLGLLLVGLIYLRSYRRAVDLLSPGSVGPGLAVLTTD